tara:strand:+ start:683 stop:1351 length:669 start_codon:yes stop_codon:yes gene_type:complete
MKFLSLIALLFAFSAHAQSRATLETEAKKLSMQMKILVERNVDRLDERELTKLVRTFERAKDILMGRDTGPGPGPFPPVPTPRFTCDRAPVSVYQATFSQIKDFAYSSTGLDLSSSAAINYAHDWVAKYTCEDLDLFKTLFVRLKNFAYSSAGLDLSASAAINYASSGVDSVCADYAFEQEFKGLYDFAYSTRGLDMSASAAREYARQRVEPNMFRCRQFAL